MNLERSRVQAVRRARLARTSGALGLFLVLGTQACEGDPGPDGAAEPTATTASAITVTGLFPTGVDATGAALATGSTDPHYVLSSTDPKFPGPDAVAVNAVLGWNPNAATYKWISVAQNTLGDANTPYTYTTTFNLSGVTPSQVELSGTWACAASCTMVLNGTQVAQDTAAGAAQAFTVPAGSPFVSGANTLAIVTQDGLGSTGLQISVIGASVGPPDAGADAATDGGSTATDGGDAGSSGGDAASGDGAAGEDGGVAEGGGGGEAGLDSGSHGDGGFFDDGGPTEAGSADGGSHADAGTTSGAYAEGGGIKCSFSPADPAGAGVLAALGSIAAALLLRRRRR